ncbi:MAG TPA: OmpA family protein [Cyclobacteriaceae bacterium]|nr:OmpA family protein [Cyclobacteriaceae bacterium]
MRVVLTTLIFLFALESFGQSTNISTFLLDNRKKADQLFALKAYRNALTVYQRMVEKNQSTLYAKQQIAECYLNLNDIPSAEKTLESIIKEPGIDDNTKYKYAQVLCVTKRYDEALDVLESLNKKKIDSLTIERQIAFLKDRKSYMRDERLFTIEQAKSLNTSHSDFGATYYNNEVVFASSRDYDLFVKRKSISAPTPEESLTHLYSASVDNDGNFGEVKHFVKEDLRTTLHDGPVTFYKNGRKAAITSNNLKGKNLTGLTKSTNVKLFLADVGPGGFSKITPFDFNSEDYSVGHATFTKRGNRIYFAANFEGGFGGSDIYYSDFVDNEWSKFINAGSSVNTAGDELYPFFVNDSTFYFASNGHGGFGGLDLFSSKIKRGKIAVVRNLGFPVNTSFDDFSLSTDSIGRRGFLSSNRMYGAGSDDIYSFLAHYIFLEGYARNFDSLDQFIPNTLITMKDESGRVIDSVRSDIHGKFELKLPFDKNLTLTATKPGYTTLSDVGVSTIGYPFSIDSLSIPLRRQKEIIAKGKIYSNETEAPLPNAVLLLKDLDTNRTDTVVLGNNGEYMFRVLPDHKYRIEATKDGFIPNGFNLNTENINKKELLNDIVVEEAYVEKTVTYFDYDKYEVKPEWKRDLNKILRTLKRYPETTLHVGAHADSRGSKEYNQGLSERRANAVVDYFVGNGVDKARITAVGFGEELILNRCSDGVVCPEEEHSKNRRAELKVQRK